MFRGKKMRETKLYLNEEKDGLKSIGSSSFKIVSIFFLLILSQKLLHQLTIATKVLDKKKTFKISSNFENNFPQS